MTTRSQIAFQNRQSVTIFVLTAKNGAQYPFGVFTRIPKPGAAILWGIRP